MQLSDKTRKRERQEGARERIAHETIRVFAYSVNFHLACPWLDHTGSS